VDNKFKKNFLIGIGILVLVIVFDPWNLLVQNRSDYLNRILTENLVTAGSIFLLKSGLDILAGSDLNLMVTSVKIGKALTPLLDVLDKGINLLTLTSAILATMSFALVLFKSWFFKFILAVGLTASLWSKTRKPAVSVVVFLLTLNPGLPIYIFLCQQVSDVIEKEDSFAGLNMQLNKTESIMTDTKNDSQKIKNKLGEAQIKKETEEALAKSKEAQDRADAEAKIKSDTEHASNANKEKDKGLWEKTKDSVSASWSSSLAVVQEAYNGSLNAIATTYKNTVDNISKSASSSVEKLCKNVQETSKAMLAIIVRMLAHVIILYVFMPIGFYYLLRMALRPLINLVNGNANGTIPQMPTPGSALNSIGELRKPS